MRTEDQEYWEVRSETDGKTTAAICDTLQAAREYADGELVNPKVLLVVIVHVSETVKEVHAKRNKS